MDVIIVKKERWLPAVLKLEKVPFVFRRVEFPTQCLPFDNGVFCFLLYCLFFFFSFFLMKSNLYFEREEPCSSFS